MKFVVGALTFIAMFIVASIVVRKVDFLNKIASM